MEAGAERISEEKVDPCKESHAERTVEGVQAPKSTITEVCQEETTQFVLGEGEASSKIAALEEINKKATETLQSQVLAWNDERERLLQLLSEMEFKATAKGNEVHVLHERLSMADCAVEHLTKTRVDLQNELSRLQSEMGVTHAKLMTLEHAATSLQKSKEEAIGAMSGALQAKSIALEKVHASLADKERTTRELLAQISSLQDVQQQCALLQQECSSKTKNLQTLSESHQGLKSQLQVVIGGHEREMDCINRKLQESLDYHASKDLKMEALVSEVHQLQLALTIANAKINKAELESSELARDLLTAKETLYNNQLSLEKADEEVATLKEALKVKDSLLEIYKNQQNENENSQQQKIDSLLEELEKSKSAERELLLTLEQEQRAVAALEDLRDNELQSRKVQETCWRAEREKLIMELNGMHDLVESKRVHEQELQQRLSTADDAVRQARQSRTALQEEVSGLKIQLQNVQLELKAADCALETLKKAKADEVMSLSAVLQARLRDLEASQHEELQLQETITGLADDVAKSQELHEKITSLEKVLKVKEKEVHALSSSQERSKLQLKALQDEHRKDTDDLVVQLEKALECKARTEKRLQEREAKLGCLQAALEKGSMSKAESETDLKMLQDNLERLQEENCLLKQNLHVQEECTRTETGALKEYINRRENDLTEFKQQIADLEVKLTHAMQQNRKWQEDVLECEALRGKLKQKCLQHTELLKLHQTELSNWLEKEGTWLTEMGILMTSASNAEEHLRVTESKLQNALSDLHGLNLKCKELEQKKSTYEEEISQLHLKLDESNMQLHSKDEELRKLQGKLCSTTASFTALVQEQDTSLLEAKKKMERLESDAYLQSTEVIACTNQIEGLKKESSLYDAKIRGLEETIAHLKKSLLDKAEEISGAIEIKEAVEAHLLNTKEELMLAKRESDLQKQTLEDMISAREAKLQHSLESMQKKDREMEAMLKSMEEKDMTTKELNILNTSLLEEKEMLNQSVNALHAKGQMLALAVENEKSVSENLCNFVDEKDRTIASLSEEVKNLQHLLNLLNSDSKKVIKLEEKVKSLENELAEASLSLRDTEERLGASEWAVQQLANEVAKAKSSLAQRERDEVLLQSRLSDMETRSKAKDRELVELDCYVKSLVKKNSQKQTEVERLTQAVEKIESKADEWNAERQKLISEMQQMGEDFEAKNSELAHLEEQLKQRQSKESSMEDAIQYLKSQLASQVQLSHDRDSEFRHLLDKLETAHNKEAILLGSLDETENKLQQVDQKLEEIERQKSGEITKLREEVQILSDLVKGKDAEITRLNETRRDLETELAKLREEMNSRWKANETELSRWREEADRATILNESLNEQLSQLTVNIKSLEEKEQCIGGELRDWTDKAKSIEEVANNLRLQLRKASEMTSDLEHQVVKEKEEASTLRLQLGTASEKTSHLELLVVEEKEELARLQVQMTVLKRNLELEAEKNQNWSVKLAMANKQIEGLNLKLEMSEKEQISMQADTEKLKESASLAHDEKVALVSDLQRNKEIIQHIEEEKDGLWHEVFLWKERAESSASENDLLRSQLENHAQAVDHLQGRLGAAESAKQHLENTCQELEVELETERNQDWPGKLATANKQIEGLNLKLCVMEKEQINIEVHTENWKESASLAHDEKLALESELQSSKEIIQHTEEERDGLWHEVCLWKERAESSTNENHLLRSQLESHAGALKVVQGRLGAAETANQHLENTFQKLKVELEIERNQNWPVKLAMANEQIEGLNSKLGILENKQISMQVDTEKWKESASHETKLSLVSDLQGSKEIIKCMEKEKDGLQHEVGLWKERAELSKSENQLLRSQLENYVQAVEDFQRRLTAVEIANQHLETTCQRLKAELKSARGASQQREKLLADALTEIQHGSRQNRSTVESRLQVLYEAMTHDDDVNNHITDESLSLKPGSFNSDRGATLSLQAINNDECGKESAALIPANARKLEGPDGIQGSQYALNHYLELCDSIIRRYDHLEKTLENLESSSTSKRDQQHQKVEEAGGAGGSDKKKKRMLTGQEVGKSQDKEDTRKPLQPLIPTVSKVVMTSGVSPCAKRRRSNDGFQDQNSCQ